MVLYRRRPGATDAIADYSERLTQHLGSLPGVSATLLAPEDAAGRTEGRVVLFQYNPFSYGRRGFAPGVLRDWARICRHGSPTVRSVMLHETYADVRDWKTLVFNVWQRPQLWSVVREADVVFVSMPAWADRLPEPWASRAVTLPVPSLLPPAKITSVASGGAKPVLILTTLGTGHPSQLASLVAAAVDAVAACVGAVRLLVLGAGARVPEGLPSRVEIEAPGYLEAGELSTRLATADIALMPFSDGVSTRRSSLMAALQHGLPIVGTYGPSTDPTLRGDVGMLLSPPEPAAFAQHAVRLARSPDLRRRLGAEARSAYDRHFDWPILSRHLLDALWAEPPAAR